MQETVLNSIKTLKRHCKVTLNVFKKVFDDDIEYYLYGSFFCLKSKFY